jgi:hypothetical protein
MGNNNYKKIIILLSVLAVGIITITVILALKDDGGDKPKAVNRIRRPRLFRMLHSREHL